MTWNIEEFRAYYNAMLHVNIKIMTSLQRWYFTVAQYFNNKINFLFSCEIHSWGLRFRQFDIGPMSSKYSTKQYISSQYCDKQMSEIWCKNIQAFLRYSNFRVGTFYFASPCIKQQQCIFTNVGINPYSDGCAILESMAWQRQQRQSNMNINPETSKKRKCKIK